MLLAPRRERWAFARMMDIYLQEIAAVAYLPVLWPTKRNGSLLSLRARF